jgi:hypothetical protein
VISRRRILEASALPALGLGASAMGLSTLSIAAARPASALSFEQPAEDISSLYLKARACARMPNAYHEHLVAEVRNMLRSRDANVSEDQIRLAVAQTTCPLCGCPLQA